MTSFVSCRLMFSMSKSMFNDDGEIPRRGEITPPNTKYKPRYCPVDSMDRTSLMLSTTQMISQSREWSLHIGQISVSDILLQYLQYLISFRNAAIASVRRSTSDGCCDKRWSANRRALLSPIEGSFESSSTTLFNSFDKIKKISRNKKARGISAFS